MVVASLLVGLVLGWFPAQAGFDYAWRDPRMCDDCHVHDYANEAYERSVHAGLTTCHDCHRVPISHYPRNLVLTPMSTGEELDVAPHVASVVCSACHLEGEGHDLSGPMTPEVLHRIVKVDQSPLHKLHMEAETRDPGTGRGSTHHGEGGAEEEEAEHEASPEGGNGHHGEEEHAIGCMDCHGATTNRAHRFEATRENCLACHEGISESAGRLSELQCQECHFQGFVGRVPH